jgi:hypothetical protein
LQLLNDPATVLGCLGVALHKAIQQRHDAQQPRNAPKQFRDRKISARMFNFTPEVRIPLQFFFSSAQIANAQSQLEKKNAELSHSPMIFL